jgi:pimeloyl-ACP methyl ester carboxylesterase
VAGAFDPLPVEAARQLAALLDTAAVELATGHAPHVEATAEFVRVLDGFLPKG